MLTVLLLFCSNTFMTIAWYGHLPFRYRPLMLVIVVSWLIAFLEYCFQVPANRIGYGEFTAYQLKIIQEIITLIVFAISARFFISEKCRDGTTWDRSYASSAQSDSHYGENFRNFKLSRHEPR